MHQLSFRPAVPGDAPLILSFIKKLGEYEKRPEMVVATEAQLHDWIFKKERAEVFFAVMDGHEIGFALFFYNFSTFQGRSGIFLEDMFVLPEYRGKGYGKAMLSHLAQLAVERGCGMMEWWCLNWNEPAIGFYTSLGARALNEWSVYRLSGDKMEELASAQ